MDTEKKTGGRRRTMIRGAIAGLGAAAVMTLAELAGRFLWGTPLVPEILAEWLFGTIPMGLFGFFIRLLGLGAKPLAFAGMIGVHLAIGGILGVLFVVLRERLRPYRKWPFALVYGAAIWLVSMAAVMPALGMGFFLSRHDLGPGLASAWMLLLYEAFALLLMSFGATGGRSGARAPRASEPAARREFLRGVGVAAATAIVGSVLRRAWAATTRATAGAGDLLAQVVGLSPEITPNEKFYKVSKNVFEPTVRAKGWTLEIKGLVERPYKLTYDELRALPAVEQYATLSCISNPIGGDLIGNALWKGVPLRDLLQKAGIKPQAFKLILRARDGYSDSFPLKKALAEGTILAYEMNGVALPSDHGFPARVIVPGIYGMKNVKWLTELEPADYDYKGFWEVRGWSDEAITQTLSRIDVPKGGATVLPGTVAVGGIAFAGDRGIKAVEGSVDGGKTWLPAEVKKALSPYTWVLWVYEWKVPAGTTRGTALPVKVRAIDGRGQVQIAEPADPLPDGATGLHTITVRFRA